MGFASTATAGTDPVQDALSAATDAAALAAANVTVAKADFAAAQTANAAADAESHSNGFTYLFLLSKAYAADVIAVQSASTAADSDAAAFAASQEAIQLATAAATKSTASADADVAAATANAPDGVIPIDLLGDDVAYQSAIEAQNTATASAKAAAAAAVSAQTLADSATQAENLANASALEAINVGSQGASDPTLPDLAALAFADAATAVSADYAAQTAANASVKAAAQYAKDAAAYRTSAEKYLATPATPPDPTPDPPTTAPEPTPDPPAPTPAPTPDPPIPAPEPAPEAAPSDQTAVDSSLSNTCPVGDVIALWRDEYFAMGDVPKKAQSRTRCSSWKQPDGPFSGNATINISAPPFGKLVIIVSNDSLWNPDANDHERVAAAVKNAVQDSLHGDYNNTPIGSINAAVEKITDTILLAKNTAGLPGTNAQIFNDCLSRPGCPPTKPSDPALASGGCSGADGGAACRSEQAKKFNQSKNGK